MGLLSKAKAKKKEKEKQKRKAARAEKIKETKEKGKITIKKVFIGLIILCVVGFVISCLINGVGIKGESNESEISQNELDNEDYHENIDTEGEMFFKVYVVDGHCRNRNLEQRSLIINTDNIDFMNIEDGKYKMHFNADFTIEVDEVSYSKILNAVNPR